MLINIFSFVFVKIDISLLNQYLLFATVPLPVLLPTRIQPSVSKWVFPVWILIPSNPGTLFNNGKIFCSYYCLEKYAYEHLDAKYNILGKEEKE